MRDLRLKTFVVLLSFSITVFAQTSTDLRGIYVSGTDFPVSKTVAAQLDAALATPGVDGLLLGIAWNTLEPGMGQYDWRILDQWVGKAVSLGKRVKLSLPTALRHGCFDPHRAVVGPLR